MIPESEDFGVVNQELNFAVQTCFCSISGAIRAVNYMQQNTFNQPSLAFLSFFLWGTSMCTDRVTENKKPPRTWHLFSSSVRDLCLLTKQPFLTKTPLWRPCLVHHMLGGQWAAVSVAGENRNCAKEGEHCWWDGGGAHQHQQMGIPLPEEEMMGKTQWRATARTNPKVMKERELFTDTCVKWSAPQ